MITHSKIHYWDDLKEAWQKDQYNRVLTLIIVFTNTELESSIELKFIMFVEKRLTDWENSQLFFGKIKQLNGSKT